MTNQHPIIPSSELLDQWCMDDTLGNWRGIAIQAAKWGADHELEACAKWLSERTICMDDQLRSARRPKPLSLKKQALAILNDCSDRLDGAHENIIRRALEALDD